MKIPYQVEAVNFRLHNFNATLTISCTKLQLQWCLLKIRSKEWPHRSSMRQMSFRQVSPSYHADLWRVSKRMNLELSIYTVWTNIVKEQRLVHFTCVRRRYELKAFSTNKNTQITTRRERKLQEPWPFISWRYGSEKRMNATWQKRCDRNIRRALLFLNRNSFVISWSYVF